MTTHTDHPDSHTDGLADGCPRCLEHTEHPERSLDRVNLRRLLRAEIHTVTDLIAAQRLRDALAMGRFLEAVMDDEPPMAPKRPLLLCEACGESVTHPASDGAFGFIQVGPTWYHVAHAPRADQPSAVGNEGVAGG